MQVKVQVEELVSCHLLDTVAKIWKQWRTSTWSTSFSKLHSVLSRSLTWRRSWNSWLQHNRFFRFHSTCLGATHQTKAGNSFGMSSFAVQGVAVRLHTWTHTSPDVMSFLMLFTFCSLFLWSKCGWVCLESFKSFTRTKVIFLWHPKDS